MEFGKVVTLEIVDLDANPYQHRVAPDPEKLSELAENIREFGQMREIKVRPNPDAPGRFQIAYGHRTVEAMSLNGSSQVSAVVADLSDDQMSRIVMDENENREDLSDYDKSLWMKDRVDKFDETLAHIAASLGKADNYVVRHMKFHDLESRGLLHRNVLARLTERTIRNFDNNHQDLWKDLAKLIVKYMKEHGGEAPPTSIVSDTMQFLISAQKIKWRAEQAKLNAWNAGKLKKDDELIVAPTAEPEEAPNEPESSIKEEMPPPPKNEDEDLIGDQESLDDFMIDELDGSLHKEHPLTKMLKSVEDVSLEPEETPDQILNEFFDRHGYDVSQAAARSAIKVEILGTTDEEAQKYVIEYLTKHAPEIIEKQKFIDELEVPNYTEEQWREKIREAARYIDPSQVKSEGKTCPCCNRWAPMPVLNRFLSIHARRVTEAAKALTPEQKTALFLDEKLIGELAAETLRRYIMSRI